MRRYRLQDIKRENEKHESRLHRLVKAGDVKELNKVLKMVKGISNMDNIVDEDNLSLLHVMSCASNPKHLSTIFRQIKPTDVNVRVSPSYSKLAGFTCLHFAVKYLAMDNLKYLLKKGANVHAVTGTGQTALHLACEDTDYDWISTEMASEKVQTKSHSAPCQGTVNKRSSTKVKAKKVQTASHPASCQDTDNKRSSTKVKAKKVKLARKLKNRLQHRLSIIEMLLDHKCNIYILDSSGSDALSMVASSKSHLLFKKDIEERTIGKGEGDDLRECLALLELRQFTITKTIFEHFNKSVGLNIEYIVEYALSLMNGIPSQNEDAISCLHYLAKSRCYDTEIIKLFLRLGQDPNQCDGSYATCVHIAALEGNDIFLRSFRKNCTNYYELDENFKTIINLDKQDNLGNTPLHNCLVNVSYRSLKHLSRRFECVLTLLNNGADMNIKNNNGLDALATLINVLTEITSNPNFSSTAQMFINIFEVYYQSACGAAPAWASLVLKIAFVYKQLLQYQICNKTADPKLDAIIEKVASTLIFNDTSKQARDEFILECQQEVEGMKSTKINVYASLHDFLYAPIQKAAIFARNIDLKKRIKEFSEPFPLYNARISTRLVAAIKRDNLTQSAKIQLENFCSSGMPLELCEKIASYLSEESLEAIIAIGTEKTKEVARR